MAGERREHRWDAYRAVLADPRARRFVIAGFVARLPISMTGLGIVLLVSITTGSFGRAGLVTACGTLTAALGAPWWGRLIDRVGQAPVLFAAGAIAATGLLLLTAAVLLDLPLWVSCLWALVAGLGGTSAGSCVRARWTYRLHDPALLNAAFALEAAIDEVVFIVGPVLVTFLATAIHPGVAMCAVVGIGGVGAIALGLQRSTEPPVRARAVAGVVTERLALGFLIPVVIASAALGMLFGGMEVVVVAFAKEAGILPYSGAILMVWACGSLIAGLVTGAVAWRAPPSRRFRVGATLLAASMVPLPFVHQPAAVAALLLLSGLAIAPTLISSIALIQSSVPAPRLNEALGWNTMGLAAGVALGAAVLGRVIDGYGAGGGFAVQVGVGVLLIVTALVVRSPRRRVTAEPGTPAAAPTPVAAGTQRR